MSADVGVVAEWILSWEKERSSVQKGGKKVLFESEILAQTAIGPTEVKVLSGKRGKKEG